MHAVTIPGSFIASVAGVRNEEFTQSYLI